MQILKVYKDVRGTQDETQTPRDESNCITAEWHTTQEEEGNKGPVLNKFGKQSSDQIMKG